VRSETYESARLLTQGQRRPAEARASAGSASDAAVGGR